ncbi:MAG TPA: type III pantothenate kinase [Gemmataceae bacterium]|nr:type III pantothenate kinase [Gemmataceae bacterium]
MIPDVVADIGNSRVKWGRCAGGAVAEAASLPPDDPDAWQAQLDRWGLMGPRCWAVAGVHPRRRDQLAEWLRSRGAAVRVIDSPGDLPLRVRLERPERVGIDRLLNAVAANAVRPPRTPAILADAGTAVTVDLVDEDGAFRGGAIFPGFRLLARALHQHTALLPLIDVPRSVPALPGTDTPSAMAGGIFWAVAGGIEAAARQMAAHAATPPLLLLTGGDGPLLAPALGVESRLWPLMTLEGIRLTAEALP